MVHLPIGVCMDCSRAAKFHRFVSPAGGKALQISTRSATNIIAAIESFRPIMLEESANRKVMELDDFGNFKLKSTAEGINEAAKVRGDQIINLIPRFNWGKQFKRTADATKFE